MVMEEHSSEEWKQQLLDMGYSQDDVYRADQAAVTSAAHAVDWLLSNPLHYSIDTSQEWPSIPEPPQPPDYPDANSLPPASNQTLPRERRPADEGKPKDSSSNSIFPSSAKDMPLVAAEGLTIKAEDDLQRAMEISRKEQHEREMEKALQLSKEEDSPRQSADQDPYFRRALEESLKDNQDLASNHNSSWHSQVFSNSLERARKDLSEPVGLRNIGNTCYLNSLLQVYYNLPDFRRAILSFRVPDCYNAGSVAIAAEGPVQMMERSADPTHEQCDLHSSPSMVKGSEQDGETLDDSDIPLNGLAQETIRRNAVEFVVELQKLFATMALGNQNCADPTAVTRAMRDEKGEPISIGAQRDASEFNQIFLDTVEKGLGIYCSTATIQSKDHDMVNCTEEEAKQPDMLSGNFVKNMFTMKFRQEIWRNIGPNIRNAPSLEQTPDTTNCETTSIIVDATTRHERNLHGGLEDFVRTQIGCLDGNRSTEEKDDHSCKSTMEHTNKPNNVTDNPKEIAHATLKTVWFTHLPPVVVVYLQRGSYNRTTLKAEKVHDRYEFPTRLEFDRYLEKNRVVAEAARTEIQEIRRERARIWNLMEQYRRFPLGNVGMQDGDSSSAGPYKEEKFVLENSSMSREDFFEAGTRIQKRLREALQPQSSLHSISSLTSERIESSLETIEKVLRHDWDCYNELDGQLKSLRSETDVYRGMDKVAYDLHAVLVHDGAPDSGHYWAFINNQISPNESEKWMKLSDSNVKLVSETEMLSWSLGGNGKASAYCLMYTAANDDQTSISLADESMSLLPQHVLQQVSEESVQFEKDLEVAKRGKESQPCEEVKILAAPEETEEG